MRKIANLLVLASLLTFFTVGVLAAAEYEESFKMEMEQLYSSYKSGADLSADQHQMLIEYGFIASPGYTNTDRVSDPDAFGYTFIDNEEDNGPEFNWIDITGTGASITGLADDNHVGPFDIGFDFPFYDQVHTQFYFQSNGTISFTDTYITLSNQACPTTSHADLIAWFWDDLDPSGGGTVYYETTTVNDQTALVISMIDYKDYPNDELITAQVIMYENGKVIIQYQDIQDGFDIETCTVGIQNSTGDIGLTYVYNDDPTGYPYTGLAVQFANSDAVIDGTVINSTTSAAIEGAEVILYADDSEDVAYSAVTDANGEFHIELLGATFDMEVLAIGYMPYTQDDLVVNSGDELDLTIELDEPQNQYTFNGTITSADTPDLAVEGVTVEVTGAAGSSTTTTDANGAYTFGDMQEGLYDIYVSFDPAGSNGYHDLVIENFAFNAAGPHDFLLYEILVPTNFSVSNGDGFAALTWTAPANHEDIIVLANTIELRRGYLNALRDLNNAKSRELIPVIEAELYMLENEYDRMLSIEENGLDELSDFVGYRVKMNDEILPDLYTGTNAQVTGLISGDFYDFEVAADYGYGDDYLLWSEEVTLEFFEVTYYYFPLDDYNWVDIDPATGAAGTPTSLSDDGESGFIDFPNGESFTFYGQEFFSFNIGANGGISFTSEQITHFNQPLPLTNEPNNFIAVFWEDLYPPATENGDPWYYYDEETNRMIVTWHNPPLGDQTNILKFQLILDLTDDYFIINYDSATTTWNTQTPTIGVENSDGTRAVTWLDDDGNQAIPSDQTSMIWTSGQGIFSVLEGTIDNSDGVLLEDVTIELFEDGIDEPIRIASSDEDGYYRMSQIWEGTYDVRYSMHSYETVYMEDLELTADPPVVIDLTLVAETEEVELNGVLMSADTPDTYVEGATVFCEELGTSVVTDANGAFTFGQQLLGVYNFDISFDPEGSTGYHNISYPLQGAGDGFAGYEFYMFEILAPADFIAQVGDGFINCYWQLPVNVMTTPQLEEHIARLQQMMANVQSLEADPEFIRERVEYLEDRLYPIQNELAHRQLTIENGELDDIDDFVGYKLRVNGTILADVIATDATSFVYTDVIPDEEYTFELAADFGYGAEYLVWTDPQTIDYFEINYTATQITNFIWEEINPNNGGLGTAAGLWTGGTTPVLPFPEGESFEFYGTRYDGVSLSANGGISYIDRYFTWLPNGIPNTLEPNNFITPYWQELSVSSAAEYDVFYYMDEENNIFIAQWYGPTTWNGTNILSYQVILDLTDDFIVMSYQSATEGWLEDITIGTENIDGTRGTIFPDAIEDEITLVFAPFGSDIFGVIDGTVTDSETTNTIEDVRIEIYVDGAEDFAAAFFTDEDGEYEIPNLWSNTYDLHYIKHGYHTQIVEDVVIEAGSLETRDVQLVPLGAADMIDLAGVVESSDTPDTPVAGASVYCYELEETQVTDANGAFSFGQQFVGQYNFDITFDPQGSTGYHNISYLLQDAPEGFTGYEFTMYEILPVENFNAMSGDGFVSLSWEAPLNHVHIDELLDRINRLHIHIEYARNLNINNAEKVETMIADLEATLFPLENELRRREMMNNNIDELEDFVGYKIIMDGDVQAALLDPNTLNISLMDAEWNFENGQSYSFSVAADYGYGDDYLVGAAEITVDYEEINYFYLEMPAMEWIEIDPATGVASTSTNLSDDGMSEAVALPNGETFEFYGVEYSQFWISANGAITFTDQYVTFGNTNIPNANTPNNIVCPFWDDLYPPETENGDPWYYYDDNLNAMIVEWDNAFLNGDGNFVKFQMIMDLTDNYFLFNYHSAANGWDVNDPPATVGIENSMGTRGVQYPDPIQDGLALFFGTNLPAGGTLEGYVSYCSIDDYDPISNAAVYVVGDSEPIAFTDAEGYFNADSIRTGWREFRIMKDGYWPIDIPALEILEEQTVSIDTVALVDPDGESSEDELLMNIFIGTPQADSSGTANFTLSSIGCGPLVYRARLTLDEVASTDNQFSGSVLPGERSLDELDEPWSYIFGMSLPDNDNMYSAVVMNGAVYAASVGNNPTLYHYDIDGTLITETLIPQTMLAGDGSGIMDMSTDPITGDIMAGNADGDFFRFSPDLTSIQDLGNIGIPVVAIAYDYVNDYVFVSNGTDTFMMLDLSTYTTTDYTLPDGIAGPITGLGYLETEPEQATVYLLANGENGGGYVYRFNPETETWMGDAHQVYQDAWGMSGGMDISNGYNPGMLNVTTVMQAATSNDFIDIWEGYAAPVSWLWIESGGEGNLDPNESVDVVINGNITGTDLQLNHGDVINATVEVSGPYWDTPLNIPLDVVFLVNDVPAEDLMPTRYALHQNYPNPFNPVTEIRFDLVEAQDVKLTVFNVLGRQVSTLLNQRVEAGFHSVSFDAAHLASGIYFYRIEAGEFANLKKMVLVK